MTSLYAKNQYRLGMILGFGALLWGGTYNALAKGLTPYLSPVSLLILSEALTAVFILMTFGLVPLLRELRKTDARSIRLAVLIGLFNSAAAPILFFIGLARTSAINASMLSSSDMIVMLIGAKILLHEKVSRMQAIGGAIVLFGIIIVNVAGSREGLNVHTGDMFILAGALFSGCGAILYKKHLSHVMPELAILLRNLGAIVVMSIVAVFIQVSFASEVAAFPVNQVLLLLAFTFFSRYLNLTFFYESLDRLPATQLSLIQVGNPVSGLFFATLILGEQIHSYQILGCTFIIFGMMVEQMSAQTFSSLRSHSWSFHLPFRKVGKIDGNIAMLPKNV